MNKVKHIIKVFFYLAKCCMVFLSSIVPKNQKIWVFGAWNGNSFSDNPKYLYLYVNQCCKENVLPIWITKDRTLAENLSTQGINSYYYKSILGIYYQLIA